VQASKGAPTRISPSSARPSERAPPRVAMRRAREPDLTVAVGEAQARAGPQALVHLEEACLLDEVDDGVAVAAEREVDAVAQVVGDRNDAVAEVGLGGRAGADVVAGECGEVGGLEVDRVDRREAARAIEAAAGGEQGDRGAGVLGPALGVLLRLLRDVHVQRQAVAMGVGGELS
jgi:hypothetical protein